ncbi:hypothetical protein TBLA_0D00400 [Henningerozyma blattae CBS 6284]|uniref:AD domain-containing protein n=1 Tax=Henningerozyma blattae (strain ATCC 34711 / CBS 6284 / DSM 70876 / NBRC 10599 / NRRL Y-10934 / UCD 77-7) TaxID=1071380 RepID=I2H2E8_HENB6|nr:hypothetical protein TBLA_0D00400 [Tetrapisispora blattae CBS 6284]CCH60550.1 hypothetical protein TBLA_0D00400 [Tetrapisispora blattae CBS 6284]
MLNLDQTRGFQVKVITVLDETILGTIYSVNSRNLTITLQTNTIPSPTSTSANGNDNNNSFRIIQNNFVKKLIVLNKPDKSAQINKITLPQLVDLTNIQNRIKDTSNINTINSTTNERSLVFETLKKTLNDTKIANDKIVVLGDVVIEAPFKVENVKGSGSGYELVKRIVDGVWQRKGG